MDRQTILLISDMRQVCLAEILTKKGHNVRCLDIRNRETALQQLEKLKRFLDKADVLILPIPVQKVPEQEIFYDILNKNLEKKTLVMGGCFSTEQRELLTGRDIHFLDFMEDTVVTEENAVATAEGTIAELVEKSPYNIDEAKVLVTGYGYCGKAIAKRLGALGARVTVLARRKEARKEAKGDGFYAVDFAFGPEQWGRRWLSIRFRRLWSRKRLSGNFQEMHILWILPPGRAVQILHVRGNTASMRTMCLESRENMRRKRVRIFWNAP